jgi:hypothetical protein
VVPVVAVVDNTVLVCHHKDTVQVDQLLVETDKTKVVMVREAAAVPVANLVVLAVQLRAGIPVLIVGQAERI